MATRVKDASVGAQEAVIYRQFAGLSPMDLPDAMRVVCTASVEVPEKFRNMWVDLSTTEPESALSDSMLGSTTFMLVVCDIFDQSQLAILGQLLVWLDTNEAGPPMALLPVSVKNPNKDGPTMLDIMKEEEGVLGTCLDDVILGEPIGFALAFAVHASFSRAEAKTEKWMDIFRTRSMNAKELRSLKAGVEATLWQYVPQRLHIGLPPVDYNLGDQEGRQIAGYTIRQRLALGADEQVYEVDPPNPTGATNPVGEMVKVVPKGSVQTSIDAVRRVQRTWQIMQTLSGRWQHPNIVRSYQLYHSPMHIYIRMEHCGSECLYHRLKSRANGTKTLTAKQVCSLVRQMADVLHHLHTGPRICHRDIKPENFALSEGTDEELTLKLVNFDTSAVQRPGGKCKLKSGTFPFVAPEVAHHKYDGMAADMWSTGILLLEVACGIRIIERCLLDRGASDGKAIEVQERGFPRKAVQRVRDSFTDETLAHKILVTGGVPEVACIIPWYAVVVSNLLQVCPEKRWTSEQLFEVAKAPVKNDEVQVDVAASLACSNEGRENLDEPSVCR